MLATFNVSTPTETALVAAINSANANVNPEEVDDIRFIGTARNATINISSELPVITEPVNIEVNPFFTQNPDYVTLNWTGSPSGFVSGLTFNITTDDLPFTESLEVNGLTFTNFTGHGIDVQDLSDDTAFVVELSEIDNSGGDGIHIDLPSNANIESWSVRDSTVIRNTVGIRARDIAFTKFNINGNFIGTDGSSTNGDNASHGIHLSEVSASSTDAVSGISSNTISGNGGHGIFLEDTFFVAGDITFNEIGVDETASTINGNSLDGIHLLRSRTEIAFNTVSGNAGDGVEINESDLVVISGNRIRTSLPDFDLQLGNLGNGVNITNGSTQADVGSQGLNTIYYNGLDRTFRTPPNDSRGIFSPRQSAHRP